MFDFFSPEQCRVVCVCCWRRERSTLKNLLICTFYLALFKLKTFCNHKQLLDCYFARRISSVCHVRRQTNLLLLLTEYCEAWIFLFTITGIKNAFTWAVFSLYFNLRDTMTREKSWPWCSDGLHQGLQWKADSLCAVRICPLQFKERVVSDSLLFGSSHEMNLRVHFRSKPRAPGFAFALRQQTGFLWATCSAERT